jgi:hypothetical protein
MWIGNTIIGLILLALAIAGAWRWYEALSKNQKMETAAQDIRETAECHLEAFKLRPGLTETDLEVQAAFMDICMEARGYVFLPSCPPMPGAHITLATSLIRFAGGRIELGPAIAGRCAPLLMAAGQASSLGRRASIIADLLLAIGMIAPHDKRSERCSPASITP